MERYAPDGDGSWLFKGLQILINTLPFTTVGLKRHLKNAIWPLSERVTRVGLTFLQMLIAARVLGPSEFGRLVLALTIVAVLAPVARLGLENILIKEIAGRGSSAQSLMRTAFGMRLLGALAVIALAPIAAIGVSMNAEVAVVAALAALGLAFQSFDVIDQYFKAIVKAKLSSIAGLVQCHVTFALVVLVAIQNGPLWMYGVVFLVDGLIVAVGYSLALRSEINGMLAPNLSKQIASDLLKQSFPILVAGLLAVCYMKFDHFLIQALLGSESLGQYAVVSKIAEGVNFIPVLVCSLLLPPLSDAQSINKDLYERRFIWLCRILLVLSITFATALTIFGERLVVWLYGPPYAGAGMVLAIIAWCSPFVAIGVVSSMYFVVERATMLSLQRTATGAITSVFLNLLLVPSLGLIGAALAAVLSYAVAAFAVFHNPVGRRYVALLASVVYLTARSRKRGDGL